MMDCERLQELLDAWLAGNLPAVLATELEDHAAACAECRTVITTLGDGGADSFTDDLVVRPVVAATTGRGCARVHEILAGDPGVGEQERGWAREHAGGCAYCAAVARTLDELAVVLPTLASEDPGPDFTAEVLLATLEKPSLWRVFLARIGDHYRRWQQRPSFAQELSYALTLALVLISIIPGSPLRGAPRQALSLVKVASADVRGTELEGTVGGQLRLEVRARSDRLGAGFDRLGDHVIGAGRGLVDGDLDVVGENAGQIGCDLRRLWTGVRAPAVEPESICG